MARNRTAAVCPESPRGLRLAYDAITAEEEAALIDLMDAAGLTRKPYDSGNPRFSLAYGWTYDFQTDTFVPCGPIPEGLQGLRETAAALAGVPADDLVECLLNRYEPGAVIQPHRDKAVWEHVVGVSLGSTATMEFRRESEAGEELVPVELPPRSIYLLAGEARHTFTHALPPMACRRWSITFRSYSREGRFLREAARG